MTAYVRALQAVRRHLPLENVAQDPRPLVHYATLAASSHNTQPWRFRCDRGRILIRPDLARRCPVVDPDDHHLYVSLGCAVENLLHAARAAGFEGHVSFQPECGATTVELEPRTALRTPLFEAIPRRQCTRSEYDGKALTAGELALLSRSGGADGVSVQLSTARHTRDQVADYVAEGNRRQFSSPAWKSELRTWLRYSAAEAVACGDGLYGPVMGSPSAPRWLGSLATRLALSAAAQNRRDIEGIRRSGAIAVIVSQQDDPAHWLAAGRCYQRLALQATVLGIAHAFINQPVEIASLRERFADALGIDGGRPDLVLRLGRGPTMPATLRRPVEAVIDARG